MREAAMTDREREVRRLWRGQPREELQMSVEEVRAKAERLEQRVRTLNVATAGLFVAVISVEMWQISRSTEVLERVGDLLTIAAFVYAAFRFRGSVAVQSMPAGLGLTGSVRFYRDQLVRRRDLSDHPWRFLLPFVPGVGLSLLGGALEGPPAQSAAVAAFGTALFLMVAWWEKRRARRIQDEIDELGYLTEAQGRRPRA
jgi:hypothetical protein